MARTSSRINADTTPTSNCSLPEGFWQVPKVLPPYVPEEEQGGLNTKDPTWIVPKKRKSRKKGQRKFHFYNTTEEELCFSNGEEVTTSNRFSVLEDTLHNEKKEPTVRRYKKEDFPHLPHSVVQPDLYDLYDWIDVKHCNYTSYDDYLLN